MDEQVAAAALATERKRYEALSEVMELTEELSEAIQRQDQVSIRMFLGMQFRSPSISFGNIRI